MPEQFPSFMLPVGPADYKSRLEYLGALRPRLYNLGWTVGLELKTGRITEPWARECAEFIKCFSPAGALTWHAIDTWTAPMGNRDFNADALVEQLSVARYLIDDGLLDAIVLHPGTFGWTEMEFELALRANNGMPLAPFDKRRWESPLTAQAMLDRYHRHVVVIAEVTASFGKDKILIENTAPFLTGTDQINVCQMGAGHMAATMAAECGVGTCVDNEHFHEGNQLFHKEGFYSILENPPIQSRSAAQKWFEEAAGYTLEHGRYPSACSQTHSFPGFIQKAKPRLFHYGAATESLDDNGLMNAHLPLEDCQQARDSGAYEMLGWIAEHGNCMGIVIEVCGGNFWKSYGYACTPRIANDELAKRATLEALILIEEGRQKEK